MAESCNGHTEARDARCDCGNLLARLTERGVEVKCRRCKRIFVIPLESGHVASGVARRTPS
jgi:phage FluMu protein Com